MAAALFRIGTGLSIDGDTHILKGAVDPSAGGGVVAPISSLYLRDTGSAGEIYQKTAAGDTAWTDIGGGGGSGGTAAEEAFIRTFVGKTGAGSETPTYANQNYITTGSTLEAALSTLDGALNDAAGVAGTTIVGSVNYSSNNFVTDAESLMTAIGDLDAQFGAAQAALTRTTGGVTSGQAVYLNIDSLDDAIGADTDLTAASRTTGPVATGNNVFANLDALDTAIGADIGSIVTRDASFTLSNSNAINTNLDVLDAAIGSNTQLANKNYSATTNSVYQNISALDGQIYANASAIGAIELGMVWIDTVLVATGDDISANSGTSETFSDANGTSPTIISDDRIFSTYDDKIYLVKSGSWVEATALVSGDTFGVQNDLTDIIHQEGNAIYHYNGTNVIQMLDVDFEVAGTIGYVSYASVNGAIVGTDTVQDATQKLDGNQQDIQTTLGVSQGALNLGTFTGSTISDSVTVKAALQALETQLETTDGIADANATEDGYQNTFTGKSGIGSETPTYSTTNVVTDATSLETAIGALDDQLGDIAMESFNSRTMGGLSSQATSDNFGAIDAAVGGDSEVQYGYNITTGNSVYYMLDQIDYLLGSTGDLTSSHSRASFGTIGSSSSYWKNIYYLDQAIGGDSDFSGGNYTSSSNTVCANLEALDAALNTTDGNISTNVTDISNLEAALGSSTGASGMDYTSTNVVTVDTSAVAAISALDTEIGNAVAGTTYASDQNVGANIEALDAALVLERDETTDSNSTSNTSLDTVLVDDVDFVCWDIIATEYGVRDNKKKLTIHAMHDGTSSADATEVDFTIFAILEVGLEITGLDFDVTLNGTTTSQVMRLSFTSTDAIDVKVVKRVV
jgi:hypothetical protein